MTACASPELPVPLPDEEGPSAVPAEDDDPEETVPRPGLVITADGAYAARLALAGESWFPERWTLDGPEPYAVPLPGHQPEEPGTEVLPMGDGRVLIHRVVEGRPDRDGRHLFSLLYPTGPGTGELSLGGIEPPAGPSRLRLLPPAPCGSRAYALAVGRSSTAVWLVAGGTFGPEHVADVPGHCSGGVWLDRAGRLLALDRTLNGRTKTVVVDLCRGGEVSPLLQITRDSDDRLLLADPDSGLLLIRSDAPSPGRPRLGWGVLGSTLPVRFPECLVLPDCVFSPFAVQPGQVLTPEGCAVALRVDGPGGSWVGVWRPAERRVHHLAPPEGWLTGSGLWTEDGVLRLPYATGAVPCGVARLEVPPPAPRPADAGVRGADVREADVREADPRDVDERDMDERDAAASTPPPSQSPGAPTPPDGHPIPGASPDGAPSPDASQPPEAPPAVARPVPLREAPLKGQPAPPPPAPQPPLTADALTPGPGSRSVTKPMATRVPGGVVVVTVNTFAPIDSPVCTKILPTG